MMDFAAQRTKMIDSQVRTEDVSDYEVIAAMTAVPREWFVPEKLASLAYIDQDLRIADRPPADRFLCKPATLGRLLQLAEIAPGERALDVGSGTGYSAAVLARLAAEVVGLECDTALAARARATLADLGVGNVRIVEGPLPAGHAAGAPYDVILVEGAVEAVPPALFDQLAERGRLVAIVGYGGAASAIVYTKSDGDIGGRPAFNADAPPLPGFERPKAFVF